MAIVDGVTDEVDRRALPPVKVIHVRLGPLSGVVRQALVSASELVAEDSPLCDVRLVIEEVPIAVHCPRCETTRPVISMQDLRCAVCGTPAPEIVAGREVEIVALEVADETADAHG
jgi:hydrogenase nickel incorporation protein HypA/HybF